MKSASPRPAVEQLSPYVPGTQPEGPGWTKLNTNELPFPASPKVAEAIAAEFSRLALYPNPTSRPLREALAAFHGLPGPEWVCVGNGSDDILNLLFRAYTGPGIPATQYAPCYSLYPVLARIQETVLVDVPFNLEKPPLPPPPVPEHPNGLYLITNPNAPTGMTVAREAFPPLLEKCSCLVVVDEAYGEFGKDSLIPDLQRFPRLCITRTFSKYWGLAGLRVGYALAHPGVIENLDRVRDSYNVNRLSQAGALAALDDRDYYEDCAKKLLEGRSMLEGFCLGRGWQVLPSSSNFLLVQPQSESGERGAAVAENLFSFLEKRRILVRYFKQSTALASRLRISIGSPEQMNLLLRTLSEWKMP